MSNYEGISAGDFAKSTKRRLPICFCLDTSGSMEAPTASGKKRIDELNSAFAKFINTMKSDPDVNSSADISIITFGGKERLIKNFGPISQYFFSPIEAVKKSLTPMGEAIQMSLRLLDVRKKSYQEKGIKYYQPWLVVITDGEPEGADAVKNMDKAIQDTIELENAGKLVVFNIGIGSDTNLATLSKLSNKRPKPISVDETNLDDLFTFLWSSSSSVVSGGNPDNLYMPTSEMPTGKAIDISDWSI